MIAYALTPYAHTFLFGSEVNVWPVLGYFFI